MVVNAMSVIVAMGNTSNAGLSIRQQKLSLLSLRSKKGGSGRNHRPLFNEDKNMLKPGLIMAQIGQKSRTFLWSEIVSFWCAKKGGDGLNHRRFLLGGRPSTRRTST